MFWVSRELISRKKTEKKRFTEDISPLCVCKLSHFRPSLSFLYFVHFIIEGKEKKQIIFLSKKLFLFFPVYSKHKINHYILSHFIKRKKDKNVYYILTLAFTNNLITKIFIEKLFTYKSYEQKEKQDFILNKLQGLVFQ